MTQAQGLANALNVLTKDPQFSNSKARAAARKDSNVDTARTKIENDGFNAEVDGCETFVMNDGSVCAWNASAFRYVVRAR